MDFFECISLQSARAIIESSLSKRAATVENVGLLEAVGRIAANDLAAQEDLPPFNRSTVDGFAVKSRDTFGAGETVPVLLTIADEILMGKVPAKVLLSGQVMAIPTGGMLPDGADSVVMLEYTEQMDAKTLLVSRVAVPGENIIKQGEDIAAADLIVKAGQTIYPQHIGMLAACGYDTVPVYQKLRVSVISTGDELVDVNCVPELGQIRDINSYTIGAMLKDMGCKVSLLGIVKDSYEEFLAAVTKAAKDSQIVIVSGGSSVGARDYTVRAIGALGNVLFHGIAIKPGKPTILGRVKDTLIFGLPGHPAAAMIICGQVVKEAIYLLMGKTIEDRQGVWARLLRNIPSAPGRDDFVSVRLQKGQGEYTAEPLLGKSGLIHTLAEADGVLHISAEKGGLYAGDMAEIFLIRHLE